jgi:4-hydroxythreonine-4-phosphate dehydrogenase
MPNEQPILLTTGDPDGIGPDLVAPLMLQDFNHPFVIIGEQVYIESTLPLVSHRDLQSPATLPPFSLLQPDTPPTTAPSHTYLSLALDLLDQKLAQALVTGPIDKKKWADASIPFKGHTELFQHRYAPSAIMFFWSETLKVALYTVHCALRDVPSQLTVEKVCAFLDHLISGLEPFFDHPCRVVVAGLNPHAGEQGIMGDEEERIIKPALALTRQKHPNQISGPFPADTLFQGVCSERDTVVVSWYHDQGLIPFKLLHLHSGVNVTLGLPFLRTSPDHGTAVMLKGTKKIDPGSMLAAARLADRPTRPPHTP